MIGQAHRTHVGCVRQHNEDALLVEPLTPALMLALVADGVGGNAGGEVASARAVAVFAALAREGKLARAETASLREPLLEMVVHRIHLAIAEQASREPELRGMASTLTVALADPEHVVFAQVGDSRLYHLAGGALAQRTEDQTLARELLQEGRITEADLPTHPDRNTLSQCLGLEAVGRPLRPALGAFPWSSGDRLLLCSDGLTDLVPNDRIEALLQDDSASVAAQALVDAALAAGGKDNVSVVVLENGVDPPRRGWWPLGRLRFHAERLS